VNSRTPHIYTDESVPIAIAEGLKRRGIAVTTARDSGNLGLTEEQQLSYAIKQRMTIFTHDDDFLVMAMHNSINHFGIVYVHQQKYTIGECIRKLKVLVKTTNRSELKNRIIFL